MSQISTTRGRPYIMLATFHLEPQRWPAVRKAQTVGNIAKVNDGFATLDQHMRAKLKVRL